ncbi:MAG: hypothetical protein BGO76_00245 [Caedibacter sp. 38-128]|nr:hypothetical protein [Holosporales bacterium]OJX05015.1 MAG: hypothetical protein BGO76_00245 [Caedibacter sp. 38-128]
MKEKIAIVGMAGRFPGAKNIDEFWHLLKNGKSGLTEFSSAELTSIGITSTQLDDPAYVKVRGVIGEEEYFDGKFFGYSNAEAALLDPQGRVFLECVLGALEDAGYGATKGRSPVGLFATARRSEYLEFLIRNLKDELLSTPFVMDGTYTDFIALRTSFKLDLKGPSVMVGTACSSSLVTVHLACKSLLNEEVDIAIAGATSISWPPRIGRFSSPGNIISPSGECRPFDESADGIVSGDAVVCIVLKRLKQAISDGDHIYAVIRGSAINNDGADKMNFTAPSVDGQVRVIKSTLKAANLSPQEVGYIEAHGTGTLLGDPIEMQALIEAFTNSGNQTKRIGIGAVKSSIGHTDAAAGLVGLVKTVLCLKYKTLVPTINFKKASPYLDIESTPFYICNKVEQWEERLIAGVQSLGMGGTNAHVFLERAPSVLRKLKNHKKSFPQLIVLSAKTLSALQSYRLSLIEYFIKNPDCSLEDIAWTLQIGREPHPYRLAIVAVDSQDAVQKLLQREVLPSNFEVLPKINNNFGLIFSGITTTNLHIMRELYYTLESFKKEVDLLFTALKDITNQNFHRIFLRDSTKFNVEILMEYPLLFSLELALYKMWYKLGGRPAFVAGVKLGEYTAATVAGVFDERSTLEIVCMRSQIIQTNDRQSQEAFQQFKSKVASFPLFAPQVPFFSSFKGHWITEDQLISPQYWEDHLCQPSDFSPNISQLTIHPQTTLIELSATSFLRDTIKQPETINPQHILTPFANTIEGNALMNWLEMIGQCWVNGTDVNWHALTRSSNVKRCPLPTYPFERMKYSISRDQVKTQNQNNRNLVSQMINIDSHNVTQGLHYPSVEHESSKKEAITIGIREIWFKTLGCNTLSDKDNFFEIGGNSLLAVQLLYYLKEKFQVNISIAKFENNANIEKLALYIFHMIDGEFT